MFLSGGSKGSKKKKENLPPALEEIIDGAIQKSNKPLRNAQKVWIGIAIYEII